MKKRWATAVRAGVSLALIGYLLRKADLGTTVALLAGARWAEAFLALVLCVGVVVVSAWRWNVLLEDGVPYRALLAVTFIGYFFNNFLPTNFGGDGVRILCVRSRIGGWGRAAASVLWDRIAGVGGLVGIGLGAYLLDFGGIRHTPMRWAYPALGLGFAGSIVSLRLIPWHLLTPRLRDAAAAAGAVPPFGMLTRSFALSLVAQLLGIGCLYCLGLSLGLSVRLPELLVFAPLANLGAMLPVSVSGLGVREGLMVYLLGLAGVRPHEALSLSLSWFLVTALVSLWGGVEYSRWRSVPQPPGAASAGRDLNGGSW